MSLIGVIARKELRAYFQSPVALIFLGIFLIATYFSFFSYSAFFARNVADARPLFQWLPLLLIFLVAAITMRQWAEEQKMGTLEVLLTLPVGTGELVLGKFAAGLGLVGLALALTLPIPVMVSLLGDLDWGPVAGGYVGALLVGATYLSIGLCVSSRTDNQVVALMLTLLIAGGMYLLGADRVTAFFGDTSAQLLRSLGTGSRFLSIERGVLDLRDLAYYAGLTGFFLTLNGYFIEAEREDAGSTRGRGRLRRLRVAVLLAGANALALSLWLTPVTSARIDMTARGEYSISDVTRQVVQDLDEPLRIDGYFSERTHPLLAPLVPQVRDLLTEYGLRSGGSVTVAFADPRDDEELEREINESYGIRSFPFRVADRHQQAVVNSYFGVLIRYGDEYATLGFQDLIDVIQNGEDYEVRLRNLEYDLTRTIKRVSQDFQTMESVFGRLTPGTRLTAFMTEATIPKVLEQMPERIRAVGSDLAKLSGGALSFEVVDPSGDAALQQRLADDFGIQPLAVDLFGRETFYLDLVLESPTSKPQRIVPHSDLPEADVRRAFESAVRRATPGQLKTVGLVTAPPQQPAPDPTVPQYMQPPPPRANYIGLESILIDRYEVERVDITQGRVPDYIDVLVVAKPGLMSGAQTYAIDQYLMQGGKVVVLAGRLEIGIGEGALGAREHVSPLFDLLAHWGVEVQDALVMDSQNAPFPVSVPEQRGSVRLQRIRLVPYPFFPDIRQDGFGANHPALAALQNVTMPWSSPLLLSDVEGLNSEVLLRTSERSWQSESRGIDPNFALYPETGFEPGSEHERQVVGVAVSGVFPSYYADRASPIFRADGTIGPDLAFNPTPLPEDADSTGRTIKNSLPDARLAVLASNEMVSDVLMQITSQFSAEVHRGNVQLIENLIDWSVEDMELLSIRTSGVFARTLRPISAEEAERWEYACYALAALSLALVAWIPRQRRNRTRPFATPSTPSTPESLG
jgi:ABC-2 type transport system permease protein